MSAANAGLSKLALN